MRSERQKYREKQEQMAVMGFALTLEQSSFDAVTC
jgi:hypothetical protein